MLTPRPPLRRRLPPLLVLLAAATIVPAAGCTTSEGFEAATATSAAARQLTPPDTADGLLFVVGSDRGRVVLDDAGTGTLTLHDVDDVTWFSDRPARDAGVTTIDEALRTFGWRQDGDAVADDAPNATLTASGLDDALVLELLTASFDGERGTFEVRSLSSSDARDVELADLDLFIDDAGDGDEPTSDPTAGSRSVEHPDPSKVAASAGFGTRATLEQHVTGLLAAVGAGPADPPDRTVRLAVSASFPLGGAGERTSLPVLLAPVLRVDGAAGVSNQIQQWLTTFDARVDTLAFDVTVWSDRVPILAVDGVALSLQQVDLPSR